jgi:hypothetical protein
MSTQPQGPARLASEDVIVNAPLSFAGSAQRIMRIRRGALGGWQLALVTLLAILLVVAAWVFVAAWYLTWGLWLVPYRLLRRGARKRKAEAMRHRELLGTIQGSAAGSASTLVGAMAVSQVSAPATTPKLDSSQERVGDVDRDGAIEELRKHMLAGRLTTDEFEQRLGSAQVARTRADIDGITIDLPR